jgi:hypothetical protein
MWREILSPKIQREIAAGNNGKYRGKKWGGVDKKRKVWYNESINNFYEEKPMKQPKVYGGCFFMNRNQVRGIMAGTQAEIAKATGSGLSYIRNYWAETGNEEDIKLALKNPGVLFWKPNDSISRPYRRVKVSDMLDLG